MSNKRRFLTICSILLFFIMIHINSASLLAEINPPFPIEGTTVFHSGDWIIEAGDNVYCGNGTLVMSGNISILAGGRLTFKNATLLMNSTFEGEFGIEIENSGNLSLLDSRVSAYNTTAIVTHSWGTTYGLSYRFNTSGDIWAINSTISHVWGGGESLVGGIRVINGQLTAINSKFLTNNSMGVYGENSNINIENSSVANVVRTWAIISLNGTLELVDGFVFNITDRAIESYNSTTTIFRTYISGEVLLRESNFSAEYNIVEGNGFYSLSITESQGRLAHNMFTEASVCVYMLDIQTGEVISENNTISNCTSLGMRLNQASPTIIGNTIQNSLAGFSIEGSSPPIINSTIKNCTVDVLLTNAAHPIFVNSTFNVSSVGYFDTLSLLDVRWYLHVSVIFADSQPVVGGTVTITNVTGDPAGSAITDTNGWARWIIVPALRAQDIDGDMVAESIGEMVLSTPHRIIASNDSLTSETSIWLNSSQSIELVLGELYNITVTKNPTRGQILVDGLVYSVPTTFQWLGNSSHSVEAQAIESGDWGTRYIFINWSDGGDLTHNFIVPSEDTILTANFRTQYLTTIELPGTDEDHPAVLTYFENGSSTQVRVWNNWQGWVDSEHQLTLSACTEGDAQRCTNDIHEWFVSEPLNATVHYETQENWKPYIAILFGIIIALIGALTSIKYPRPYKQRSRLKTWLIYIVPISIIEMMTGLVSLFTGELSIPPVAGLGVFIDVILLMLGIIIPFIILYRLHKRNINEKTLTDSNEIV